MSISSFSGANSTPRAAASDAYPRGAASSGACPAASIPQARARYGWTSPRLPMVISNGLIAAP
nr:hypothetical protein [Nonomuraea sp. ATCC 55076]